MAEKPIQHADTVARFRALLVEALTTEHVFYEDDPDDHAYNCPGCDLRRRIREALSDEDEAGLDEDIGRVESAFDKLGEMLHNDGDADA